VTYPRPVTARITTPGTAVAAARDDAFTPAADAPGVYTVTPAARRPCGVPYLTRAPVSQSSS